MYVCMYVCFREVSTRRTKKQEAKVGKSLPNKGLRHFSVKVCVWQRWGLDEVRGDWLIK